jgi:gamma-glutamylcyclotransferase (GGCT)/AIG2-like uncharacterized protein YtfP
MTKTIYFAYGSNMVPAQMAHRCPGSRALGTARLEGYRWLINERGVATIAEHAGGVVHGVLWELEDEHVATLDEYEGLERGNYYRAQVRVLRDGAAGDEHVMTYIDPRTTHGLPREGYLEPIVVALEGYPFPPPYCEELGKWLAGGRQPARHNGSTPVAR